MGDNREEKARISMAVLNLASEIETQNRKQAPSASEFEQQRPHPSDLHFQQQNTFAPQTPQYIAQCLFSMDSMQYFLSQNGQIFMVNPFTKQSMPVGMKMPPQTPQFAWTLYFSTTNIYYLVDHAGIIWGQNYGMPAQYGTVKYL